MSSGEKPWRDEELMRELYHEKRMSQRQIAEHFDNNITPGGIGYVLDDLGIEKRSRSEAAVVRWEGVHIKPHTDKYHSYEVIRSVRHGEHRVLHHRLLAVAKYGFDEVDGMVVHHKSGVEWDNRWSNIELMTEEEHAQHHGTGRHDDEPWHDEDLLRELRVEQGLTIVEIADRLGCSDTTVWRSLREHRVEDSVVEQTQTAK